MLRNEKLLEFCHSLIVLRVDFVGVCVKAQEQCVLSIPSCCHLSNTHPNHACHAHMAHDRWHMASIAIQTRHILSLLSTSASIAIETRHILSLLSTSKVCLLCSLPPPTHAHAHEEKGEGWRGRVKGRMRRKGRRTWRGRGGGREKGGEEEGESVTSLRALTMGMEARPLVSPWNDATTYLCPELPTHVNAAKSPVLTLVITFIAPHVTHTNASCHTYQ